MDRKGATVAGLVCLFLLATLSAFAQQDTNPPAMTSFTFSPAQVDTTSTSATVTATANFTDDLSGVSYGYAYFRSPSGQNNAVAYMYLSSGTNLNGTYSGTASIPAFSEPGVWTVDRVWLIDNVGNSTYYYTSDLQAAGYPTNLTVTSQQDTAPPAMTSFTFSPSQVDTTSTSATVTATANFTDDLSGVLYGYAYFRSPSGQHNAVAYMYFSSGTTLNGTYSGTASIPAYSEPGVWTVDRVWLIDNVGNSTYYYTSDLQAAGYPTTLTVTSQQDTSPPAMTSFTFSPTQVDTTSVPATITATANFTDDISGVSYGYAYFRSPSAKQSAVAYMFFSSGTTLNGTYSGTATIPAYSEPGVWTVDRVWLIDNVQNSTYYYTSDLQNLGFPTSFQFGATTSVALTSSLNSSTYGQSTTFTATVTATNGTIPTGTVTFNEGSTTLGTGTLDASGTATFTTSSLSAGPHSIVAAYSGDTNFSPANSTPLTQTVNQASSAIALSLTPNPSSYNQPVSFTATITPQNGVTATGNVTFTDGTTTLGTATLSGNTASYTSSTLSTGTHSITATYSGDANVTGSTSSAMSQVVNQAATVSTIASSANPVTVTQPVTFTATVGGAYGGTPTGSVTFMAGTRSLGSVALSGGIAALTYTFPSTGTRSMTAVYSGDPNFAGSTSGVLNESVAKANSSTTISSSLNPSVYGQAVTFTATVSSSLGAPPDGELVTFKNGSATLGSAITVGGVATFTTSTLAAGTRNVKATYNGDSKLTSSMSSAVAQVIQKATTATSISSSLNPSNVGQAVTFTVTVAGQYGATPSGTITFTDNGAALGTATLSGGGATLTTSSLAKGTHMIKAGYGGDSNFKTSSISIKQTVN